MNIDKIIKNYKFKVKFRDWQMLNDKKLIGKTYDYAFELFIYDVVEPLVKDIIDKHLEKEKVIKSLNKDNTELKKEIRDSYSKRLKIQDELQKYKKKINNLMSACESILDD